MATISIPPIINALSTLLSLDDSAGSPFQPAALVAVACESVALCPAYDLPIAVGILLASEQVVAELSNALFLGELALDGQVRHSHGILSMVALAKERGLDTVYVPQADGAEAALIEGVTVIPVAALAQLAAHLAGFEPIEPFVAGPQELVVDAPVWDGADFADIKGQEHVKRALEVAAAGGHNLLKTC